MIYKKFFRRAAMIFFAGIFFATAALVGATVKLYTATGEGYAWEDEQKDIAKLRARDKAIKKATKQAGVVLKTYSRSIDSELTDDEITAITSNAWQLVGEPKYTKEIINHSGDTQIIVWKATVEVNVDDAEITKWVKRDDKEKSTIITQTREAQKSSEENDRKVENLREQYKRATSQAEKDNLRKQMNDADSDFLANQKLEEGLKLHYAKDYHGAIKLYNEVLEFGEYSEAYNNRGLAYDNLGQYERAIADFNKAIELDPTNKEAYNNRGAIYDILGQYERAIADCNKAIQLNQNYFEAYNNRGNAYYNQNQYERAIADFNKAIELNPNFSEAYNNRGLAYDNLGQYERAIADFNKAIELDPTNKEAYNNRGGAYYNQNQYERAIADFSKAIQLNPNFSEAYNNRGYAYQGLKQYERAIADYNKALELMEHPVIYGNRGESYYYLKNYKQAFADLNKAIELGLEGKDLGEALYYRGLCYRATGDESKAQADFAKAKQLSYNG